ncbi:MAG TPA: FAD:protein FMN transferase [Solirubrobacterales bacterium]|nr:FAD:protein FMN transferase [Solirubrobacterales bacterium]
MSGEAVETFECFGGRCSVRVGGAGREVVAAVLEAKRRLLAAHATLSRFDPDSELSRLNRDPRREAPASPLLREVVAAARTAGLRSGGLVDATLADEIEAAGYAETRSFEGAAGNADAAPPPRPAAPAPQAGWCLFEVDERAGTVSRPPGVRLDPGGIAKGLMADLLGESLAGFGSYAVDCCGDLRIGGADGRARAILVEDPTGGEPLHELRIAAGAVATSGITRRAWTDDDGRPAHQILDPATGRPAFTGVVQATAVAPTGLLAETLAKSALLVGPERAGSELPFGGVIVEEGGAVRVVEPGTVVPPEALAG